MASPNDPIRYLGHLIRFVGISTECPDLKLFGYRDEYDLAKAIYRTLKKRGTLPPDAERPAAWFNKLCRS